MTWGGVAAGAGALIGGVAAGQAGGEESGYELPWYQNIPTKGYFNQMAPYKPGGEPRNHGGFWGQYDPSVYKGDRTAQMPSWFKDDLKDYANLGADSSTGQAEDYYQRQVAGDYLGLSPEMRANVMNPAMQQTQSMFAQAGRSGLNPANIQSINSSGMSALMPYFDRSLDRQMSAAGQLPGFDDRRMDSSQLRAQYMMNQDQGQIDDKMYRHDFRNNKWLDQMQQFQGLLNPSTTPMQTTTAPSGDWMSGAAGGASLGYGVYDAWNNRSTGSNPGSGQGISSMFGSYGGV